MSTKMADENKGTASKREYGEVDSSPGMTPPSKLIQADPETKAFTYSLQSSGCLEKNPAATNDRHNQGKRRKDQVTYRKC